MSHSPYSVTSSLFLSQTLCFISNQCLLSLIVLLGISSLPEVCLELKNDMAHYELLHLISFGSSLYLSFASFSLLHSICRPLGPTLQTILKLSTPKYVNAHYFHSQLLLPIFKENWKQKCTSLPLMVSFCFHPSPHEICM